MDEFLLANEFPAKSEADWCALVDKALAGTSFDTLRANLYEGFKTEPLYTARSVTDRAFSVLKVRSREIIQPIRDDGILNAKSQLLDDLQGDAKSFWLEGPSEGKNGKQCLSLGTVVDFEDLFSSDISSQISSVHLGGGNGIALAALLVAYMESRERGFGSGSLGLDPLTNIAIAGEIPAVRADIYADSVDAAFYVTSKFPAITPFLPSDRAWHGAGGSATQELGFTLAAGVSYWRALTEAGMPIEDGAKNIGFGLTAAADIFLTIAKFRAMRLMWQRAVEAAGIKSNTDLRLIAETSHRMLSEYDSYVNLLRGTAAAFGATVGGATGIRILPFDAIDAEPNSFSRRLARNTSLILEHESSLLSVADAAAGSYYVETLTHKLAEQAWMLFREVEAKGGLAAALGSGFAQNELDQTRQQRKRAIAKRKDKITGVSVFPNLGETVSTREVQFLPAAETPLPSTFEEFTLPSPTKGVRFAALVSAARKGATVHDLQHALHIVKDIIGEPLRIDYRSAEAFEVLRQGSDLALNQVGSRPPIFLALLGNPEDYRDKANWARGFFATAGIEMIVPEAGLMNIDQLVATFKECSSPVACLCSSKAFYGEIKGAASALKKAGAVFLYVAAPPAIFDAFDPLEIIAVDRLIYDGCDALAVLREAHEVLRVSDLSQHSEDEDDI